MDSAIGIRPFVVDDGEQVSRVIIRCLREVNSRDYTSSQIERLCREFSPSKVRERFGNRASFVAFQNDVVVGTATLDGDEIRSVFVRPDLQNKGIGRVLMEQIEVAAKASGADVLRGYSSLAAIHFYLHLGYEKLREKREADGEVTIEIEKQLLL